MAHEVIGVYKISQEGDFLSIRISRNSLGFVAAIVLIGLFPVISFYITYWIISRFSSIPNKNNIPWLTFYLIVVNAVGFGTSYSLAKQLRAYPLVFDRQTGRILRSGKAIGRLKNACNVFIVREVDYESGDSFEVRLALSPPSRGGVIKHLELGGFGSKRDALVFADWVANFLGIGVVDEDRQEVRHPRTETKSKKTASADDLE